MISDDSDVHQSLSPPSWPITDDAIRDVFAAMLHDGSWGRYHGPHCQRLREALAEFHGVEHITLCSSGTSAVELSLRAAKVEPGDEVILAAYDYKANFANVLTLQAIPVLVDTLPGIPVLDPSHLEAAITKKTRAIICSHLHGSFARIAEIKAVATAHEICVIEDACQAAGGILKGQPAGSMGDLGMLSFGGSKLLTAGRGGAILTNDAILAQRIRLYTQRGNDAYPLSEMQAAVLMPQLEVLPQRTKTRLQNVGRLCAALSPGTSLQRADSDAAADSEPAFYKLALRYAPCAENAPSRDDFSAAARQKGVALDPAFSALHLIHSKRRFRATGSLQNAEMLHSDLMTLHHPVLLDTQQVDASATVLNELSSSAVG